jgi:serine/threonine protein kinase
MSPNAQATAALIVNVIMQVTRGLEYLHSCGILHRNITCDNVVVASIDPLSIKIAGYGCAIKLGRSREGSCDCTCR